MVASGADATGAFARAAANVSLAISDMVVAVSRLSVAVVPEIWTGVDLIDAIHRAHGATWFVQDPGVAADMSGFPMER